MFRRPAERLMQGGPEPLRWAAPELPWTSPLAHGARVSSKLGLLHLGPGVGVRVRGELGKAFLSPRLVRGWEAVGGEPSHLAPWPINLLFPESSLSTSVCALPAPNRRVNGSVPG